MWEDDEKGNGHDPKNLIVETKTEPVSTNGLAIAEFQLTKAFIQKAMKGEADAKQLEFYVTVEYYKGKIHDSKNVNVNNPLYQKTTSSEKKNIQPKAKDSPAEQKPIFKKEEKGIITKMTDYLVDFAESNGIMSKVKEITIDRPKGNSTVGVEAPKQEKQIDDNNKLVIFPLLIKAENDSKNKWGKTRNWTAKQGANMTTFNSNRDKGKRKHAGRDLYTNPLEPIVAIADGVVLSVGPFYCKTHQITIRHKLKDGRDFIIRYGELDPKSIELKVGDEVKQKNK